ncbi:sialin-like [Planococcus citri]|uniref:sialin-like n=1 Tax=Planococcus citri TaxID=170843 RepID=UPI0031F85933
MNSSPYRDTVTSTELLRCPKRPQRQDVLDSEGIKLWGSRRLLVVTFVFFCHFYLFMLRGNLSIAIVEMTSEKNISIGDKIITQKPEFAWDMKTKGWVLSLFSYGFCFGFIGGFLTTKYGGVTICGVGILTTAILTMLSPLALRTNIYLFGVGRMAEGFFESFAYASTCDIFSRWIPKHELPKIVAFSFTGYHVGAAVTFPVCGFIAQYWGWSMIFYFSGSIAIIWSILFFLMVRNDPSQDERISASELRYLTEMQVRDRKTITYPWRKIFTSKALWALCLNKIAYSWAQMTMVFCFPLYIKDITNKDVAQVGVLSGIPNVANVFITPIAGLIISHLQNNLGYDASQVQKSTLTVGLLVAGVLFFIVGFSNFVVSLICSVFIVISLTIQVTVVQLVVIGISRDHAGFVAGVSAFWFSASSIVAPLSIGYIVVNHTWEEWCGCFALSGSVMIFTAIITVFYGSSNDQGWSSRNQNKDVEINTKSETLLQPNE